MKALTLGLLILAALLARSASAATNLWFSQMEPGDRIIAQISTDICHYDSSETISHTLTFEKTPAGVFVTVLDTSRRAPRKPAKFRLLPQALSRLDETLLAYRALKAKKTPATYGCSEIRLTFIESGSILGAETLNSSADARQGAYTFDDIIGPPSK